MRQYKDSGIEWIGKIPDTWDIKRLKEIFVERNNRDAKGKTLLSVSQYYGIKPKAETDIADSHVAESYDDYKVVEKGDFVMNIMLAWNGSYAVSDYEGIVSPAYCVYQFRKDCCHKYLHYLLRTDGYQTAFKTMSRGIIDSRLRLYPEQFYTFNTIFPPVSEQQRIADYLDEKCGEVDSLIALQEQMIEKLKDYKQSVITEAVTKGLDPNTKLVPSGIDWIGLIPERWKVCRFKSYIHLHNEKASETVDFKINLENIESKSGRYIPTNSKYEGEGTTFKKGDVLFGKLRPYLAKVYAPENEGSAIGDIYVFRPSSQIDTTFLKYTLLADTFVTIVDSSTYGTKMPRANWEFISCVPIVVPSLSEQQAIASYLDEKCADIDRLIALKQQKIEKLKDYKKSVIYEAVTGKTDII